MEMTPFAAFITLKKSPLKDKNGVPAIPSPPILFLLHQAQLVILNLTQENSQLRAEITELNNSNGDQNDDVIDDLEIVNKSSKSRIKNFRKISRITV